MKFKLIILDSLENRSGLSTLYKIINSSFNCPELLERIVFLIPQRQTHSALSSDFNVKYKVL